MTMEYQRIVFGNVLQQPLESIWRSRDYASFRRNAVRPEGAVQCGACWRPYLVPV